MNDATASPLPKPNAERQDQIKGNRMNTNSNADQRGTTGIHPARQTGVKFSTFVGTTALSLALLGVAAGWIGHKPAVLVKGEVEATTADLAPPVAGKVQAWHVRQGDTVRKGQLLVSLQNQDLQIKLERRRAATGSTNEPDQAARTSWVEAIEAQSNCWVQARAVAEQAQQTVDRSRELQAAGVISVQELRVRERDLDQARNAERAARANFGLAVALCGEVERLAAAVDTVRRDSAALENVIEELRLTSPMDGEVQRRIVEEGEGVTPGSPVASIVDMEALWVRLSVPEDLLNGVRVGSTLRVRVPALGNKEVVVKVTCIEANGGIAAVQHAGKTGELAQSTVEVRAVPVQATAGLRPGMTVLVDWGKFE